MFQHPHGSSGRRVLQDRGAPGAPAAQQRTQDEVQSSLGYTFTFGLEIRVAELGSRFPSAQLPGGAAQSPRGSEPASALSRASLRDESLAESTLAHRSVSRELSSSQADTVG